MKAVLRAVGHFLLRQANEYYETGGDERYAPLSESLAGKVDWQQGTTAPSGELFEVFRVTAGAHKWHHYFEIYEELFEPLRHRPLKILEIGVYKGASLQVWHKYFHADSLLVGVDIQGSCRAFDRPTENVHVRIGPQQDAEFMRGVANEFGPFDLIIDDGSHMTSHMIGTFNSLFENALKDGGLYVAEDVHTNFWPNYQDSDISFLSFCYTLVDAMHAHYKGTSGERSFRLKESEEPRSFIVPKVATLIKEVRFWDSVVAIRKSARPAPRSQHW